MLKEKCKDLLLTYVVNAVCPKYTSVENFHVRASKIDL